MEATTITAGRAKLRAVAADELGEKLREHAAYFATLPPFDAGLALREGLRLAIEVSRDSYLVAADRVKVYGRLALANELARRVDETLEGFPDLHDAADAYRLLRSPLRLRNDEPAWGDVVFYTLSSPGASLAALRRALAPVDEPDALKRALSFVDSVGG